MSDLYEKIRSAAARDLLPMHMPGHKRNTAAFGWLKELGAELDFTEIAGLDDLHSPDGVLAELLSRAARPWGAKRTFLSVNGSTGGIFAAVSAFGKHGVLVARNCHRSVFAAAERLACGTEFLLPRPTEFGIFGSVFPSDVAKRLDETGCKAVILTSPTYEGAVSDIKGIAREAHARGALLIVDSAHGAHFGLAEGLPETPVREGADVTVMSLHKTLPALTQTALVHVAGERADAELLAREMSAFVTSSPSYPMMASVDGMLDLLRNGGGKRLAETAAAAVELRAESMSYHALRVLGSDAFKDAGIFAYDPFKVYIDFMNFRFGGKSLHDHLRDNAGAELEADYPYAALAYLGAGDDAGSVSALKTALSAADAAAERVAGDECREVMRALPERVAEAGEVRRRSWKEVPFSEAAGAVSAESVWVYPPGVPVVLPGERVSAECAEMLACAERLGIRVAGERGRAHGIAVVNGQLS